ncbi:MAG: S8 family serine peptidase [Firmicutes bacterium]|nr:S8 family serine peptidase [Bacillota bacterium]
MNRRFIITIISTLIITLIAVPSCAFADMNGISNTSSDTVSAGAEYVPGEVIVSFSENTGHNEENSIIENAIEEIDSISEPDEIQTSAIDRNTVLLETNQNTDTSQLIEELQDDPSVEAVQPNYYYTADSTFNDPQTKDTWYVDYLDLPEAWSAIEAYKQDGTIADPSNRVVIATLDSGIYLSHEDEKDISDGGNFDLAHCKTTVAGIDPDSESYDPAPNTETAYPNPLISHGNSTSSVIGATSNNGKGIAGIAAGFNNDIASVMAINVFRKNINSEHKATSADICAGIDYACRHNARVIMMCLGHEPGSTDGIGTLIDDAALEAKINWAANEKDVVFVASAGNRNNTSAWYPSDFDSCVSVINTGRYTDIDSKSCKYSTSSYGQKKDISAPGSGIMHCTMSPSGYTSGTGTSYSTPIVAAIAGLVRYVNPTLTQSQVKSILYSTATDLYTPGYDIYTGYGNVNAYGAVTAAVGKPDKITAGKLSTPHIWAKSASRNSIRLSWTNVGAYKYSIYRSTNPSSGFSYINTVNGTSWTNTGLSFNKKYYYKVVPKGTSSDGKRIDGSSSGYATSRAICGTPSLTVKVKGKKKARIYWSKAAGASGYQIYKSSRSDRGFKRIKTVKKCELLGN